MTVCKKSLINPVIRTYSLQSANELQEILLLRFSSPWFGLETNSYIFHLNVVRGQQLNINAEPSAFPHSQILPPSSSLAL